MLSYISIFLSVHLEDSSREHFRLRSQVQWKCFNFYMSPLNMQFIGKHTGLSSRYRHHWLPHWLTHRTRWWINWWKKKFKPNKCVVVFFCCVFRNISLTKLSEPGVGLLYSRGETFEPDGHWSRQNWPMLTKRAYCCLINFWRKKNMNISAVYWTNNIWFFQPLKIYNFVRIIFCSYCNIRCKMKLVNIVDPIVKV